jgi:hypothetical protein
MDRLAVPGREKSSRALGSFVHIYSIAYCNCDLYIRSSS